MIYQLKFVHLVEDLLLGEKNGNLIGQKLNIVQKDALIIKLV